MNKISAAVIILVLFIGSFLAGQAAAEVRKIEESAVILFMQGDVKLKKTWLNEWGAAAEGMILSSGDQLKTGANSWVELGFGEDYRNVVRIQEQTLVELAALAPVGINLLKGELRSLVEKLGKDETFEVTTPTSVCGVRGTGWDTSTDGKKVVVDVFEDEVYFAARTHEGDTTTDPVIGTGKRGILEEPAKPIVIENVPIDKMQDWNRWKEDFIERRGRESGKSQDKGQGEGEEGVLGDTVDNVGQMQKSQEDMRKGKENIFEKRDQDQVDDRAEKRRNTGGGGYE